VIGRWAKQTREQFSDVPILPLEELAKLPQAEEFDAGVYFLWQGPNLIYIGKSRNIPDRLQRQSQVNRFGLLRNSRCKIIPHDRHTALVLEKGQFASPGLDAILWKNERAYIAHYLPAFNNPDSNGGT
jgi:hypothetical protein